MKYLTIGFIKVHSRIDYDCENDLLEEYGCAAERMVLNLLGRSLDDLKSENDGEVPDAVMTATLMLVENLIQHRVPAEQVSLSVVPYAFDLMLKPYIKL